MNKQKSTVTTIEPIKETKIRGLKSRKYLLRRFYLQEASISFRWLRWLGYFMALSGGAINTLGFFAFDQYTSHMSGLIASISDNLYLGNYLIVLTVFLSVFAFILGATHSSWTIIWLKKHRFHSSYALSMWIEACYLIIFGLLGHQTINSSLVTTILLILMCFIMGMHNAILTILSNGVIRTTHMTGHVTDLGIEFSKLVYNIGLEKDNPNRVPLNWPKIKLLVGILNSFILGGIIGAWGFFELGYRVVLPIAIFLLILGSTSIQYDLKIRRRLINYKRIKRNKKTND